MSATLVSLLERAARLDVGGLRFVDRDETASELRWPRLRDDAAAVAGGLLSAGVEPGERVVLIHPTGREFFAAFFGVLLAGAVPVPLYPPVRLGRMDEYHRRTRRMIELVGARLVLADGRVRRVLGETVAPLALPFGCRTLEELDGAAAPAVAVDEEALALVQFSSGTTVDPKPVALSHRAVVAQARILNGLWPDPPPADAAPRHAGVSWLPLYHDMGLIGCVFPALERPAELTLLGPELFVARPALWLRAISRWRATVSPAPNFAYALCTAKVRDEELDGVDLSSWLVALDGAEPVSATTLREFARRFAPWGFRAAALTPVYGLSEAALAVTFPPLGRGVVARRFARGRFGVGERVDAGVAPADGVEVVSVGSALPGFALELRDDEGRTLPEGRIGRVWVRGPSLMHGYLGRPEATAAAIVDGWLDTGDLGVLVDGELHLTGRAKDLVIVRGRNHAPEEIEAAVAAVPGVRAGCVAVASHLPEGAAGEEVVLMVEHARDATPEEREALARRCAEAVLTAAGLPARVEVLSPGTLLRTSSGKLRRQESLRQLLAGTLAPPDPTSPLHLASTLVRSQLAFARGRLRGRRARS